MSSFWIDSVKDLKKFDKIDSNYECDVCIIGGGLTGLSTGYYLSKIGFNVIIVEKDFLGEKTSGNSTAKITYQHKLIYDYLIKSYGENYAKAYLNANKEAIINIKNIIDTENIDCDFEFQSNYVYTTNEEDLPLIHAEIKALHFLEDDARFVTASPLPFKIVGALLNKHQAQFNPAKYMLGLANSIIKNGSLIFCNSTASDFSNTIDGYKTFVNNYTIKSKYIVVATHYPFKKIERFLFHQNVSIYILCFRY